ncbi:MAG: glutamate 5-kinase [Candidatus Omnitrophica bacterium]|nr:glutamate 5-kinase [Candidatus Omnitrophota bacterium]
MQRDKRIVVKVGTKVITSKERSLDRERIKDIVGQVSDIRDNGIETILVTSGAIGAGMWTLGMKRRPSKLEQLQATASIGQNLLMQVYSEYFRERGYIAAQILLTQEDFNNRSRYLNIKHTLETLLKHGAVPVINENDTVATEEIRCGDNDRLSSLVADLCRADRLIILTDVDGLMDEEGKVIPNVYDISAKILRLGGKSRCDLGTGGMATKIASARAATKAGITCVIANGRTKGVLCRIVLQGERLGTTFESGKEKYAARKRWIAFSSRPKGVIRVDEGAKAALCERDRSLLASGITSVSGDFSSGDVISIADSEGREFGRGVAGYSSGEISRIKGKRSTEIAAVLGYKGREEVIHKDNLVIL